MESRSTTQWSLQKSQIIKQRKQHYYSLLLYSLFSSEAMHLSKME